MNVSFLLVFCVCLSVLSGTLGAPHRSAAKVNFTECKALSIKLNEMARDLYKKVEPSKMAIIIDDPPVSIRPIDTCDPWSLQNKKETCQSRIILALKNYTRIFQYSACSNFREQANNITDNIKELLRELKFDDQEPAVDPPLAAAGLYANALCRDSVERLFSFSIISARVFSFLASSEAPTVEMKQC